ncbi:MAG TPA: diaminopimelate decarboxylase [Candidatus Sulfotelmatobacter sp.]|nr:diaminopimelate decarboxylase [Candidatus Sulfotelmatobacter sp.]
MSGHSDMPAKRLAFVDPAAFTPHFSWKKQNKVEAARHWNQAVVCESVRLVDVADKVGTPTYAYSRAAIDDAQAELHRGLGSLPHTLCFAVKSNGNLAILKHIAKAGNGFDIVSGGELEMLQTIGVRGDRIVFSGVGKTREEIRAALQYRTTANRKSGRDRDTRGIVLFNIESEAELEVLLEESSRTVTRGGALPGVSIRVNPDVQAGGHPHISTGRYEHKFGLNWEEARRLYLAHADSHWICWQGISVHIGSQIVSLDPFRQALQRLASYFCDLRSHGILLKFLDFGGGLGVRYTKEKPPARELYARMVAQILGPLHTHLLLEPGRTIIGPAGVLLTRVLYVKESRGKTFVVVDAGMNDLLRPVLYGATHPITRVTRGGDRAGRQRVDVVGPVCETGDCFLRAWPLGPVAPGDVLAIWVAGAYAMSQSSNYNGRCRAAEVLVDGGRYRVIRKRESFDDLVHGQVF